MLNLNSDYTGDTSVSRFAHFTTEEHAEYQAWLDARHAHFEAMSLAPSEPTEMHTVTWEDCYTRTQWLLVSAWRGFIGFIQYLFTH